jgi:hypothetical protein
VVDIFDFMDCVDCPYYKFHKGRTGGDPDSCYPDEAECSNGDFGNDYPCERMRSRIKEGLQDGDFDFSLSCLVNAWCLTDPETKEEYSAVLEAWPDINWSEHPYWRVFYDDTAPMGFDTVEEVYAEVFR